MLLVRWLARETSRFKTLATLAVVFGATALPTTASASTTLGDVPQQTWGTNGRVIAILSDPGRGRVYVAGNFSEVTNALDGSRLQIANVAAFVPATGTFDPSWTPNPNGAVTALALRGKHLYLGGDFTRVGPTTARQYLAAVNANTAAVGGWNPTANGKVRTLAVTGKSVYVGGDFTTLANGSRAYLGRVNRKDASLGRHWAPRPDGPVHTVVVSGNRSHVYVGGEFLAINGFSRSPSIAKLSTAAPGRVTTRFVSGKTNRTARPPALDLHLAGTHLLAAVSGYGGGCASLDSTTGKKAWNKHAIGNVQAVTAMNGTVYCGGHFGGLASFDGYNRSKLAAVMQSTGLVQDFHPVINSALGVWSLGHDASRLYAGGDFTKISTQQQPHFAVFD